ncbi:response regulator transcription factor [Ottowia caeni]|uniref:response regulator n=1 Tax=Ottowia caeni TaxID=2870339 RepID=UPI001E5E68CA|nr:response regulator transcription factor [Ottowia caeni]
MNQALLLDDLPDALTIVETAVREAFNDVVCTTARSVREAMALIETNSFDLALVDLSLGDGHGRDVIAQLAQRQSNCAIVVSTIHDDDENLFQALQAGAQGYLLKDHPISWLATQLKGIVQGQPPLSPAIARRLLRHFQAAPPAKAPPLESREDLSAREREVLCLLAQGVRIAEIGESLGISRYTVGDHVKNIYRKLNISSRAEAALRARGMGLA